MHPAQIVALTCVLLPIALSQATGDLVCKDESRQESYPVGLIASDDPCSQCACAPSGRIYCSVQGCRPLKVSCPFPVRAPGECCSTCPKGCEAWGKWHLPGHIDQTSNPCKSCTCDGETGEVTCTFITCPVTDNCVDPVTPEGECCAVCHSEGTQELS